MLYKIYRSNIKYQYSAILDSGIGASDRNPRERAARDRAFTACTEWLISSGGRYEVIAHLDDIGSRSSKHWFLLNDSTVRMRFISVFELQKYKFWKKIILHCRLKRIA